MRSDRRIFARLPPPRFVARVVPGMQPEVGRAKTLDLYRARGRREM